MPRTALDAEWTYLFFEIVLAIDEGATMRMNEAEELARDGYVTDPRALRPIAWPY